jgi:hypothetical protein
VIEKVRADPCIVHVLIWADVQSDCWSAMAAIAAPVSTFCCDAWSTIQCVHRQASCVLTCLTISLWRLQAGVTRFPSPFVEGYGWDDETGELEYPGATPTDTTAQACHVVAAFPNYMPTLAMPSAMSTQTRTSVVGGALWLTFVLQRRMRAATGTVPAALQTATDHRRVTTRRTSCLTCTSRGTPRTHMKCG